MEKTMNDIIREWDEREVEEKCASHCEGCTDECEHYINAHFVDDYMDGNCLLTNK